jgi:hypothetical protein
MKLIDAKKRGELTDALSEIHDQANDLLFALAPAIRLLKHFGCTEDVEVFETFEAYAKDCAKDSQELFQRIEATN